jgi:hypothetical protein
VEVLAEERAPAAPSEQACVQLGLIATPTLTPDAVAAFAADLASVLRERYPGVRWEVSHVRDALVEPPVDLTGLIDAARNRLLDEGWDLAVVVTDLPLRLSRRPLLTHSSPTHGVALVSLPAFGVRMVSRRLVESTAEAVSILIGDSESDRERDHARRRVHRRLVELASDAEDGSGLQEVTFLARVVTGNIRLILGMIRANRPWRLIAHLSRALLAALAAASFALVTFDVWRLATTLNALRLAVLTVVTIGVAVVTLIGAHGLWERSRDRRTREQVVLFNLVTAVTVTFGIASLYAAVFIVALAAAALLIEHTLFEQTVHHPVGVSDYLRLAWFASSLATVGGALGGVVESDAAVREAAYAYRSAEEGGE